MFVRVYMCVSRYIMNAKDLKCRFNARRYLRYALYIGYFYVLYLLITRLQLAFPGVERTTPLQEMSTDTVDDVIDLRNDRRVANRFHDASDDDDLDDDDTDDGDDDDDDVDDDDQNVDDDDGDDEDDDTTVLKFKRKKKHNSKSRVKKKQSRKLEPDDDAKTDTVSDGNTEQRDDTESGEVLGTDTDMIADGGDALPPKMKKNRHQAHAARKKQKQAANRNARRRPADGDDDDDDVTDDDTENNTSYSEPPIVKRKNKGNKVKANGHDKNHNKNADDDVDDDDTSDDNQDDDDVTDGEGWARTDDPSDTETSFSKPREFDQTSLEYFNYYDKYIQDHKILELRPEHIMHAPKINFLPNLKNPCFFVKNDNFFNLAYGEGAPQKDFE